jgi:hypothetical protein
MILLLLKPRDEPRPEVKNEKMHSFNHCFSVPRQFSGEKLMNLQTIYYIYFFVLFYFILMPLLFYCLQICKFIQSLLQHVKNVVTTCPQACCNSM